MRFEQNGMATIVLSLRDKNLKRFKSALEGLTNPRRFARGPGPGASIQSGYN